MHLHKTQIEGCYLIENKPHIDQRGSFLKIFHQNSFINMDLECPITEQFFSVSKKNVLRGMHFQTPPYAHVKLVTCILGSALDVVLDLRKGSPTYGRSVSFELSPASGLSVWIPKGMAHGFLSLEDQTGMLYNTTHVHVPESDAGICWNSFGFSWPCISPVLSDRDVNHPRFDDFETPFNCDLNESGHV
jgi:dTDP-4-dehydrorhamnose 3,5-epimerase